MASTANWNSHHHSHHRHHHRREPENPSFSSTLLDAIYRSIDDAGEAKETMRKGQNGNFGYEEVLDMASFRRACMIEKWMEKKKAATEKVVVRRKSMADFDRTSRNVRDHNNTSSSSSDSSSGGFFSSSESSCYNHNQRPKPIRTSEKPKPKPKAQSEGGFVKTKTKALKLYGDLKKVKQPISPGGRLASFLNSIFTAKNAKNAVKKERVVEYSSSSTTTCSSASSFSRSCLSKTPASSQTKSVRFCPVSVIVDEDCQPCGHKNVYGEKEVMVKPKVLYPSKDLELEEEKRRVQDLLKSYHLSQNNDVVCFDSDDEGDDDDDASCCSSDLFELDNLSAIGIERYNEELPVYETTHLDTNRAIANLRKKNYE